MSHRRLSLLGFISMITGITALVAIPSPVMGFGSLTIAAMGLTLGVLAFVKSAFSARTGSGVPMLGILLSLAALALTFRHNGRLTQWINDWRSTPVQPVRTTPTTPPPAVIPANNNSSSPTSIFDFSGLSNPTTPRRPAFEHPAPDANSPLDSPLNTMQRLQAPTVAEAHARLTAAMAAVEHSLESDPAYQSAVKEADAAEANKNAVLAANLPGSPEVIAASQQWLSARAKVQKKINAAAALDPDVQAAQQDMLAAQEAAQAKQGDAKKPKK